MGAIVHVIKKKLHYVGPVLVEAKFLRHIGRSISQFITWLDRKIGYVGRWILWKRTKTISNQVMFFPYSHTVGCNLKYISDELIRRRAPVEIYWSVSNPNTKLDLCEIASKEMDVSDREAKLIRGEALAGKKLSYWQKQFLQDEEHFPQKSKEIAIREYQGKVEFTQSRLEESSIPVRVEEIGKEEGFQEGTAAILYQDENQAAIVLYEEPPTEEELKDCAKIEELGQYVKEHVHFVKTNLFAYFEAAASSHILFTNSLLGDKFYPFPTKKDQLVVETWHGSLGIKRFDPAHYNTNVTWPVAAKRTGELTSYIISNSDFEDSVYRETFWKNTPILKYGHARNDIFFPQSEGVRNYLRREFCRKKKISEDAKFALYAPTFRDDHNFAVYDLNAQQTIRALEKRFGGRWKLLVRYHDNDKKNEAKKNTVKSKDVIDVTKYPDMQSLLAFTDCGITDYSSWIYDYVLMKKPGFIFAMDQEKYNNERGFYFRLEDTPFPVAVDSDELEENILSFDEERFQNRAEQFLSDKSCMDDGNASARIADQVMAWCRE